MKKEEIELLAPAGNMEKLSYAIAYGADAVYAGVPMFSLRAKENKFNLGFLKEAVEYCRQKGKKIYFTTNIVARNFKIQPFLKAFEEMNALKPDAYIVSDPGLIMLIRENFPDAVVHVSVQQNIMNWATAKFWHKLGAERVILSRELSLPEIAEIKKQNPDLEIESFVHGAVCMSHSGRCLISNYLTGRDANQGICAQSCRWNWKMRYFLEEEEREGELFEVMEDEFGTYLMNSRDLCAIDILDKIIEAGVMSLKVEGRNKTAYYVAMVMRAYRKALDDITNNKKPDYEKLMHELETTAHRGFMKGFFEGDMCDKSIEYGKRNSSSTHEFAGIVESFDAKTNEIELNVKNRLQKGEKLEFCFPNFADDFNLEIDKMRYEDGTETESAHGGDKNIFIKIPSKEAEKFKKEEIFCLLRKELQK